jgi:hypothetical protein
VTQDPSIRGGLILHQRRNQAAEGGFLRKAIGTWRRPTKLTTMCRPSGRGIAGCPRFRGSWPGMWEKVEKNSTSQRRIDIIKRNRAKLSRKYGKRPRRVKCLLGSIFRSIRRRGFRIVIDHCCEYGQNVFRQFQKKRVISKSRECPFADWLRLTDCFLPDLFNRDLHVRSEGPNLSLPAFFEAEITSLVTVG